MDRSEVRYRPPDNPQLRVRRWVVVRGPVVILVKSPAVSADQDRPERMMSVIERDAGEFDAATQMLQINLAEGHRSEVYVSPASRPAFSRLRQGPVFGQC
jgi:hypothetical protein